jgi:hypothetical protein
LTSLFCLYKEGKNEIKLDIRASPSDGASTECENYNLKERQQIRFYFQSMEIVIYFSEHVVNGSYSG